MSIDFSVHNQMGQMATGAATSAAADALKGSLMGKAAVMVESPQSLLADAAEELTFSVDTTDEY